MKGVRKTDNRFGVHFGWMSIGACSIRADATWAVIANACARLLPNTPTNVTCAAFPSSGDRKNSAVSE